MSKRKREKSDEEEHHKKQLVEDPEYIVMRDGIFMGPGYDYGDASVWRKVVSTRKRPW